MIAAVNQKYPQLFVARGVQNGIYQAFAVGVRKLNWDMIDIQARGVRAIKRFSTTDAIDELFDEVNVRRSQIDSVQCVRNVAETLDDTKPKTAEDGRSGSPAAAREPLELRPSRRDARAEISLGMEDLVIWIS